MARVKNQRPHNRTKTADKVGYVTTVLTEKDFNELRDYALRCERSVASMARLAILRLLKSVREREAQNNVG